MRRSPRSALHAHTHDQARGERASSSIQQSSEGHHHHQQALNTTLRLAVRGQGWPPRRERAHARAQVADTECRQHVSRAHSTSATHASQRPRAREGSSLSSAHALAEQAAKSTRAPASRRARHTHPLADVCTSRHGNATSVLNGDSRLWNRGGAACLGGEGTGKIKREEKAPEDIPACAAQQRCAMAKRRRGPSSMLHSPLASPSMSGPGGDCGSRCSPALSRSLPLSPLRHSPHGTHPHTKVPSVWQAGLRWRPHPAQKWGASEVSIIVAGGDPGLASDQ